MLWKGTELGKLGKLGRAACAVRGKPGAASLVQTSTPPPGTDAKEQLQCANGSPRVGLPLWATLLQQDTKVAEPEQMASLGMRGAMAEISAN